MKLPNFQQLAVQNTNENVSYAQRMHPDPRYYKYRWWVFWRGSACDGGEFLSETHAICTAEAMQLVERLTAAHEIHWVYNRRIPRDEPGVTPFDKTSKKWSDTAFALPLACDSDASWHGFR